ncbi:hypothetical protein U4960_00340 [Altererythrobacter sp. H2]|uniref:hypothetical protein n=1 Tax=Sphingomonadales TaxID=204457 RepID=UPI00056C10FA|nr:MULTISPECIES: hypothetical protein [Erythrobacteraceae]WRK95820.1 hypothetical protein U4960_00340 [Altererythrobacter sp. H2]
MLPDKLHCLYVAGAGCSPSESWAPIHIDEALKLAVRRTSDEIERLLEEGVARLEAMQLAS